MTAVGDPPVTEANGRALARDRHSRRMRYLLGLLILAAAAAVVVAAEALSLVKHAQQAQASLEAFKTALANNDPVSANRDLRNAEADLAVSRRRYDSLSLSVLRHVPILSWPVTDAGHLLTAATDVSSAGQDALRLFDQVRGTGSKLFHHDVVSLSELRLVTSDASGMVVKMSHAEHELRSVHGAFWEPGVGHARQHALRQVTSLRSTGEEAQTLLALAPGLVGAKGPRTYLVAVLNPAELENAGGAALNMLCVRFDRGRMQVLRTGSTADLTDGNKRTRFSGLPNDPWLTGKTQVLAASDRSPDFRTSGLELMRGYHAQFGQKLDGIIALDPIALSDLLAQIPPFATPGYGVIDAGNVARTLLVDSYVKFQDVRQRHVYNDMLMTNMLHRVLGGGHMVAKARALMTAAKGGHLQILMNDARVQEQVSKAGLLRTLPPPNDGDVVGVYTANANASKVDFWQHRMIEQDVLLGADGSATVTRTVTVVNASPPYRGPGQDPGSAYLTRISTPRLALYVPGQALVSSVTTNVHGRLTYSTMTERGFRVLVFPPIILMRGASVTVVLRYQLPVGTFPGGRYHVDVAAQPTVQPAEFKLVVTGRGACSTSNSGWTSSQGSAYYVTTSMDPISATVVCR